MNCSALSPDSVFANVDEAAVLGGSHLRAVKDLELKQNPALTTFPRDQDKSAFSEILKPFILSNKNMIAAIFMDGDGECIDYYSRIDSLETKVIGAQVQLAWRGIRTAMTKIGSGKAFELSFSSNQSFFVRQIGHDHALVVMVEGNEPKDMFDWLEIVTKQLRKEASIKTYYWDDPRARIQVQTRCASGWAFAPDTIAFPESDPEKITDVFGRWEESPSLLSGKLICFKVRTEKQKELTLVFDEVRTVWTCLK